MGLWTSARCVGLVPYFGQDGYRAQVTQHPIDTYRYLSHTHCYATYLTTIFYSILRLDNDSDLEDIENQIAEIR